MNATQSSHARKKGVEVRLQDFAIALKEASPFGPLAQFWPLPAAPAPKTSRFIVHRLSTTVPGSSLFAIMGGSGSGKTTLLNVLAGRFDQTSYHIEGQVEMGRQQCSIGYVTQMDFLLPHLTVRETLMFTAKLKIASDKVRELLQQHDEAEDAVDDPQQTRKTRRPTADLTLDECYQQVVQDVIMDLGLKECADSRIGEDAEVTGKRGISGGEKRRVSVALQILTDPEGTCCCDDAAAMQ